MERVQFQQEQVRILLIKYDLLLMHVRKMLSELKDLVQKGLFTQVRPPFTTCCRKQGYV